MEELQNINITYLRITIKGLCTLVQILLCISIPMRTIDLNVHYEWTLYVDVNFLTLNIYIFFLVLQKKFQHYAWWISWSNYSLNMNRAINIKWWQNTNFWLLWRNVKLWPQKSTKIKKIIRSVYAFMCPLFCFLVYVVIVLGIQGPR